MTCPVVGFPNPVVFRRNGHYFSFPAGPILPQTTTNQVSVTVFNPGDRSIPAPSDAYSCRVEYFWDSQIILIGPIELSAYFNAFGTTYQTPTPPAGLSIPAGTSQAFPIMWSTAGCDFELGTLFAQAQIDGQDSCPPNPPSGSDPTDCTKVYNAGCHVIIAQLFTAESLVGPRQGVAPSSLSAHLYRAAGIVNRSPALTRTHVDVRSVLEDDRGHPEHVDVRRRLALGGRWLKAKDVRVGLGVERVVEQRRLFGRPANLGPISVDTFGRLRDGELNHRQEFDLRIGETRQILIEIEQTSEARPGDFYVVRVDQRDESSRPCGGGSIVVDCAERPLLLW